jgi:hypothetical protein
MSFVFPASDLDRKVKAVALQLRRHLTLGSVPQNLIGLTGVGNPNSESFEGLRFVQQQGTGEIGDATTYVTAQVIFPDDEEPGVPRVRIVDVIPEDDPQEWFDQEVVRFRAIVDCWANEYMGVVTEGAEPGGADSDLAEWVWNLLTNKDAMDGAGFIGAQCRPGALEIQNLAFHIPMTISFECYFSQT